MEKILKELKVEDSADQAAVTAVRNMPYYSQLVSGLWRRNLRNMPACKIIRMLKTAAYMGLKSYDMLDQLLWKIGQDSELFSQYFEKCEHGYCPIARKFGNEVLAEIRGFIGRAPYTPGQVYAPDADLGDAVRANNIRLAKYLKSQGEQITDNMLRSAVCSSNPEVVKWMLSYIKYDSVHITIAVNSGRIDLLPMMENADLVYMGCNAKEAKGHYECVKYVMDHTRNFPFALGRAIQHNHFECFCTIFDANDYYDSEYTECSLCQSTNADIWRKWFTKRGVTESLKNLTVKARNSIGLSIIIEMGGTFDFNQHIKCSAIAGLIGTELMEFWSTKFSAWKIVQVVADGKAAEMQPGEIRCGEFTCEIKVLRQYLHRLGSEAANDLKVQNSFIQELLRHRVVEYNGIRFKVEFNPVLVPLHESNVEQITWETVELLLQ